MKTTKSKSIASLALAAALAFAFAFGNAGTASAQQSRQAVNAIGKQPNADEITEALRPKAKVRGARLARENSIMLLLTFDTGSSELTPPSKTVLEEFGKSANSGLAGVTITIEGHADPRGSVEYNLDLSRQRAEAVREYLVRELKVDSKQLKIAAMGKAYPKDPGNPEAEINRRVEFVTQNPN